VTAAALLALASVASACGGTSPPVTPPPAAIDGATCVGVEREVCAEVLAAALNNLARNRSAFRPPATVVRDACRDEVPDDLKASTCWYVTLRLVDGQTPQVIMARRQDGVLAQVGGDAISGQIPDD
jgi:hypothetical protein